MTERSAEQRRETPTAQKSNSCSDYQSVTQKLALTILSDMLKSADDSSKGWSPDPEISRLRASRISGTIIAATSKIIGQF